VAPTAVQAFDLAHETLDSVLVFAPFGSGVRWTDQPALAVAGNEQSTSRPETQQINQILIAPTTRPGRRSCACPRPAT
jgi:hypothetical protein